MLFERMRRLVGAIAGNAVTELEAAHPVAVLDAERTRLRTQVARYNRGLAAYELGSWQDSLRAYEYALSLKPDSIDARYNFALALKAANYVDDSAQQLTQILRARPNHARAHFSLGSC